MTIFAKFVKATAPAGVIALAFNLLATPATSAQGATSRAWGYSAVNTSAAPTPGVPCSNDGWVHACFSHYGDVVWVKDTRADGHPAAAFFGWNGIPQHQACVNRLGKKYGWTYCKLAKVIPEHESMMVWPMEVTSRATPIKGSGGTQIWVNTTG